MQNEKATITLPVIGFGIIMAGFGWFASQIFAGGFSLNIATWVCWVVIDVALLVSLIRSKLDSTAMVGFTLGATSIMLVALFQVWNGSGQFTWGLTETIASVASVVTLLAWFKLKGVGATLTSTSAMYIAMIPTLIDQWQNPEGQDPVFWGMASLGCLLQLLGTSKSFQNSFFPFFGTIFNGLACVFCLRQFFIG